METDLLSVFADPSKIESLTTTQRLWAGLITTILGMGITFVVLIVLQLVTSLFEKFSGPAEPKPAPKAKPTVKKAEEKPVAQTDAAQTDGELVSAIAASLAMMLETPASNIVIRGIRRVEDTSPPWSRAGIAEQMQTRI
jgi:sodium pump decarboxylase gamma subunit